MAWPQYFYTADRIHKYARTTGSAFLMSSQQSRHRIDKSVSCDCAHSWNIMLFVSDREDCSRKFLQYDGCTNFSLIFSFDINRVCNLILKNNRCVRASLVLFAIIKAYTAKPNIAYGIERLITAGGSPELHSRPYSQFTSKSIYSGIRFHVSLRRYMRLHVFPRYR